MSFLINGRSRMRNILIIRHLVLGFSGTLSLLSTLIIDTMSIRVDILACYQVFRFDGINAFMSMGSKFLQDIYLKCFLIFRAIWSNLVHTLLSPSKVIWHRLFLLNVSVVFVNTKKCSAQNRAVFIKTIT